MSEVRLFRVYQPEELGLDGYPVAWHRLNEFLVGAPGYGIKDIVRTEAGNRCVRCQHPYAKGAGEWSPCDDRCDHGGPFALIEPELVWTEVPKAHENEPHTIVQARTLAEKHGLVLVARWRILTVHHLNGIKADLRWWNLVALCQRDHLAIQRKVVMDRPWPWPHTEWFKPYAAAFYAQKYLGLELSRSETMARLDELLAVGAEHESVERMAL